MRTVTIVSMLSGLAFACGAQDNSSIPGPGSDTERGSETESSSGSNGDPTGSTSSGASAAAREVVFNEVVAVGSSEWIEIANKGSEEVVLDGYYVADSDKDTGEPKKRDAMRFPAGTKLAPKGRLLIMASMKDGTVGPHPKADCLPDGPETCFYATFGLSATTGESIHLLAPNGTVITSSAIPKALSADAGGSTTESRCRIPDLTGEFVPCAMTPGAPNVGL